MSTRSNWHVLAVSIILTTLVVAFTLTVRLIAQDDPASWVEAIIGGKAELLSARKLLKLVTRCQLTK